MNWEARAKVLQRQVDELEFRVDSLESALRDHGNAYFAGLTATEEKLAQLLRHRSPMVVTKQAALDLLYAYRSDGEAPEIKIIDVYVCKLRKKLDAFGITIETAFGRGYLMPEPSAEAWDTAAIGRKVA